MELYLDVADISGDGWLDSLIGAVEAYALPADFAWVVEGPLRSLDGEYFDIARDAEADREVLRRLVACAVRLGASGVVIHCMPLVGSPGELTPENRQRAGARAEPFLADYTRLCLAHGLVPTIENVPPVSRMREAAYMYPVLGTAAADLVYFCDRIPGLRATCDTSHAQLYLNAATSDLDGLTPQLAAVARYARESDAPSTLDAYIEALGPRIYEAHISNAAGILDEGLPYEVGVADLDSAVERLLRFARFLVTEPIEPVPARADRMRDAARRIMAVRRRSAGGGAP